MKDKKHIKTEITFDVNTDLLQHRIIVFCCDHFNPLGAIRSLGEADISPVVVLVSKYRPYLVNNSKYCKTLHVVKSNEEGLNLIIGKYGSERRKPFIITCSDDITEFLDDNYDRIIDNFYFFNNGEKGGINYYNRKDVQCALAHECGIDIPRGEVVKKGVLPVGLNFPVITKVTKSTSGAWKDDVFICKNEHELQDAYKNINADELLVQEMIKKKNELCIDGLSINGGEEVFLSYTTEYIRVVNGDYGNYMWLKRYDNNEIKYKIKSFIRKTNFSGIFCFECLITPDDNFFFLECNFRNSGWSYAHTCGGVNLPYLWVLSELQGHIDKDRIQMKTTPFKIMVEPSDLINSVFREKQIGLWQWIKDLVSCDYYYYYNSKDKKPLLSFLLGRFRDAIRNRFS